MLHDHERALRSSVSYGRLDQAPHQAQPQQRPRFLSEADCHDILNRLHRLATGGGFTAVTILSYWSGNVRWGRNQINTTGEVSDNWIEIQRMIDGALGSVTVNETTDAVLLAGARQAERLAALKPASRDAEILEGRRPFDLVSPAETPSLFSEATYQLDANQRAKAAIALAQRASAASMLSSGYIEVSAHSRACIDTTGRTFYDAFTRAQYSVTVRNPAGTSSGWAGTDHHDWSKIDPDTLTGIALDKCLKSQNPVRIEPGRYTTILEPQAVYDFVSNLFKSWGGMDLADNLVPTTRGIGPFNRDPRLPGYTRLGEKVIDERITISADPMDPEMSFPAYEVGPGWRAPDLFPLDTYRKVTWIDRGVLTHLAYSREEAINEHDRNTGILNSGAFHMTGGTMTLDEMIATTKRGLLVTRFDQLQELHFTSQLYRGYTRDGLWLIENGKISKAAKNLACTESILFALNNVEQLGVPKRIFQDAGFGVFTIPAPAVVPPLKIRDFSFTALTDAV